MISNLSGKIPDIVKENIRKKFQNAKLPLVDEAIALDAQRRQAIADGEALKAERNKLSKANGPLFGKLKKCTDETEKAAIQAQIDANNAAVKADADRMATAGGSEGAGRGRPQQDHAGDPPDHRRKRAHRPRRQLQRGGGALRRAEGARTSRCPTTPTSWSASTASIWTRAGRVSGSGFYYLLGDIARLHEAVLAYARDFMIDKGFTYCIPPFMIHGNVVEGVMSQTDMDAMMYKIEGEDLYLIGTSEHSMIGKFIDQILPEDKLPQTLTSYSPCFRKEKGAHGIEERGVYRIHQFEKQEMIVVCKPEDSKAWYEKLWQLHRGAVPQPGYPRAAAGVLLRRSGRSEGASPATSRPGRPRQQKYFEVCSCSNLGDAQARRLKHPRTRTRTARCSCAHTLNNTVVAPPRMLIAFLENNLQADGSVLIPEVLRPYMGGKAVLTPKH